MDLLKLVEAVNSDVFGTVGYLTVKTVDISMRPDVKPYSVTPAHRLLFPL